MLEIKTKSKNKKVEIDGYGFEVRKPGAGEALIMQKSGREITAFEKLKKSNKMTEKNLLEEADLTVKLLEICMSLFNPLSKEAETYLQTLDVEVLMDVVDQVFEDKSEPEAKAS